MADPAAKREARRRRILENSENRLKKITGTFKDSSPEENLNSNISYSKSLSKNGYATTKHDSITESKEINETHTFLDQVADNDAIITNEMSSLSQEYITDNIDNAYPTLNSLSNENWKDCDNSNTNSKFTSLDQISHTNQSFLYNWFFSPMFSVLLAAFVNILILVNVNFSLYKGILTPYFILAITRLCLSNKSEESQGSSMLMAALILCNIKPQIVHTIKNIITFSSTIFKDFALYLTSFVLFNWIISVYWVDLSYVKFS